jgi:hypothetical protein
MSEDKSITICTAVSWVDSSNLYIISAPVAQNGTMSRLEQSPNKTVNGVKALWHYSNHITQVFLGVGLGRVVRKVR